MITVQQNIMVVMMANVMSYDHERDDHDDHGTAEHNGCDDGERDEL